MDRILLRSIIEPRVINGNEIRMMPWLVQEVFISTSLSYHAFQRKEYAANLATKYLEKQNRRLLPGSVSQARNESAYRFSIHRVHGRMTPVLHEWPPYFQWTGRRKYDSGCFGQVYRTPSISMADYRKEILHWSEKADEVCHELDIAATNLWKILQRSRMQLRKCIELNWFDKLWKHYSINWFISLLCRATGYRRWSSEKECRRTPSHFKGYVSMHTYW